MDYSPFHEEPSKERLKQFIMARVLVLAIVMGLCSYLAVQRGEDLSAIGYLYLVFLIVFGVSLLSLLYIKKASKLPYLFVYLQLAFDLLVITTVVAFTGKINSFFIFLYIISTLSASALLSFEASLMAASLSSVLIFAMIYLDRGLGLLPLSIIKGFEPLRGHALWTFLTVQILVLYLTSFLGGYFSYGIKGLKHFQLNLLFHFPSGLIVVNNEGKTTFMNPSACQLLGYDSPEEALGRPCQEVLRLSGDSLNPILQTLEKGQEFSGIEFTALKRDGNPIPLGMTTSLIKDQSSKLQGVMGNFIDLTQRKNLESQLRQRDRLAAIGQLAASLAHEIRNPLAAIRGAVQELSSQLQLQDDGKRLMEISIREVDQLNSIVSDFLRYSSVMPKEFQRHQLSEILDEVCLLLERDTASQSIVIEKDYPHPLQEVVVDYTQIKEAFINLGKNSLEAMPNGGRLTVYARPSTPCMVRFIDQGMGIDPKDMPYLFDPFFTTKPRGTGMGLAIVHRIITGHNGSISIESKEGQGTTTTIHLPETGP